MENKVKVLAEMANNTAMRQPTFLRSLPMAATRLEYSRTWRRGENRT